MSPIFCEFLFQVSFVSFSLVGACVSFVSFVSFFPGPYPSIIVVK